MTDVERDSTVPRRQLGRHLRQLRERAGVTVTAASGHLDCSVQKVWRIEKGACAVRVADVRELCDCYGVDAAMTEVLVGLARQTRAKGWWHSYGDAVPEWFELYVSLEAAATRLRKFDNALVPGLLQAPAYMDSMFEADEPELSGAERRERVIIKTERRGLLTRHFPPPPRLEVIIWEPVLRCPTDTPGALDQQLFHLLEAQLLPNVSIRVLPLAAGPHRASVTGAFTILDFPVDGAYPEPSTVYMESRTGALYLDRHREVQTFERIWAGVATKALGEEESSKLITAIMREMNGCA
jgi:transcriptional regulator with XRE-family HTH domain